MTEREAQAWRRDALQVEADRVRWVTQSAQARQRAGDAFGTLAQWALRSANAPGGSYRALDARNDASRPTPPVLQQNATEGRPGASVGQWRRTTCDILLRHDWCVTHNCDRRVCLPLWR